MNQTEQLGAQGEIPRLSMALRTLWIFLQASSAYLLAEQVSPFFYQQF